MTVPRESAPPASAAMQGLKGFQRRTVEYAFRRLYQDADSTHRFLVADEVGLGKTMVARGVIAKAVEHLWGSVGRIDVVYVCSNADIARQNISRLQTDKDHSFARATRATLLPIELKDMAGRRVNYISMTPGTSLEPSGGMGRVDERVLLFKMLRKHWEVDERVGIRVFRGGVKSNSFRSKVHDWIPESDIHPGLHDAFLKEIDRLEAGGKKTSLRSRFEKLAEVLPGTDEGLTSAMREDRRRFIADLRALLGRTCINALRPDLVILDEFQRFKHLLDPANEDAELARSLFEYADAREGSAEATRVLLLSATPYKMYSLQHEQDNGDANHYEDFVATYDFLVRHRKEDNVALRGLLRDYRGAMYRLGDGGLSELQTIKRSLQERLRLVMARTERLAVTSDRSGMLREMDGSARLEDGDVRQYLAASKIASELGHGEIVEYWKSAPYLLNFMDDYDLKRDLRAALGNGDHSGLATALSEHGSALLSWEDVQAYRRIDPANARLRCLLRDTVETGAWKLLWLPPSMPYYRIGGAFAGVNPTSVTKRLVFSSWKVVPKVIAAVLSHEAERQMVALSHSEGDTVTVANSTEGRKRITTLLRFTRADNRLTGMPVLGLIYPSFSLAEAIDPAHGLDPAATPEEAAAAATRTLALGLQVVVDRWGKAGVVDERWYWAAPILLDRLSASAPSAAFWERRKLAAEWSGDEDRVDADGDVETESVWADHVQQARSLLSELAQGDRLGAAPDDLAAVLGKAAVGNPAVTALRSLARVTRASLRDESVRLAAGRVAWRFRNLFNLPEIISLVRGLDGREPYWLRVTEYGVDGCLQAVLDEYVHVLRDSLGVSRNAPPQAAASIADEMARAVGLRSAAVGLDDIRVKPRAGRVTLAPQRMRSRFAARFGQQQSEDGEDASRADQVRAAFNSPFWPFVLASTSVGQEGLDFHNYCHAIVHWNLPSNPVDLEQREGRIHRYKGHAVRKNVALAHGGVAAPPMTDRWEAAFASAASERSDGASDLVPFWVYARDGGAVIERHVPTLPLSRDAGRLVQLRGALALYRMVFGQPRQDELVRFLQERMPPAVLTDAIAELRIDLEPA